jgi:hypothetical protein
LLDHPRRETVSLSDIQLNLERSLSRDRPETVPGGYQWDVDMAHSYSQLQGLQAWEHLRNNMLAMRETLIEQLTSDPAKYASNAKTIQVIGLILKVPAKMIEDGKSARKALEMRNAVDQMA